MKPWNVEQNVRSDSHRGARWRKVLCCVLAWVIIFQPILLQSIPAYANPIDGVVSGGAADISTSGNTLNVNQQTDRAVIDWRGFDIAQGERTQFNQPSSSSIALNRVHSNSASRIDGQLSANGNLVIVNQNGIVFGSTAAVDVNGIIATTADTRNEQFMGGGKLVFDIPGNPDAAVINEGTITAKEAGLVGLVAPRVENHGVIRARMGRAQLASGDTATVDFYGDGLLEVAVSDDVHHQIVNNTGNINADGGVVAMTAAAGKSIVDSVIYAKGNVRARSVGNESGKILIAGLGPKTDVWVDGNIDAAGNDLGQTGGAIHVVGSRIAIMNQSRVDVSGNAGGGEILIGGDVHGGAIDGIYPTASRLFVGRDVVLAAHSDAGNGGKIINWSENGTAFYGHGDVSGAGNGGFIEISGKDWLGFNGSVNASAGTGVDGTLLLDPADITISNAADTDISASTPFQNNAATGTSNLSVATLVAALNGAANVIISSAAGSGGVGDITFVDAVAWNSIRTLTVNASNDIIVNNTITNSGTGGITLNANVAASGNITVNNNITVGGAITMLANRDLTIGASAVLTTGATGGLSLRAAGGVVTGVGNLNLLGSASVGGTLTLSSGANGSRPSFTWNGTKITAQGLLGTISITGFDNIIVASNMSSGGHITLTAMTDLTVNATRTITNGSASAMTLNAANGSVAGVGNLTINGALSVGNGGLTMVSGANGTRPNFTWGTNITAQSVYGAISVTGFQDVTINTNITGNSNITFTAQRNLTVNATRTITTGAAGALTLQSANAVVAGTGSLILSGTLRVGTGALTLVSGINGSRPNLTWSGTNIAALSTMGAISITGFQDITVAGNMTSSGSITLAVTRNLTVNAGQTVTTGAAGALTLTAASAVVTGVGTLSLNGSLSVGTGTLTLLSGINGSRPNFTWGAAAITAQSTYGAIAITGFQDIVVASNITSTSSVTLGAFQNLTQNALTTITTGASGGLSLTAANSVVTGTGNLTLNGNVSYGSGTFTLISGINGTRPSLTMTTTNFVQQGATIGTVNIQGFQDITLNRNITSNAAVTIVAQRNLTLNAANTIATGSASALSLQAANGNTAGTGNLTLSGSISAGTGALTLLSGVNGARPSYTMTSANFTQLGASVGAISITGFQNLTINRDLTSSGNVTMLAFGDLTLSATRTLTTGAANNLSLRAANNVVAGTGNLTLAGNISMGTGTLTLSSGINGTRPLYTMTAANFVTQGATVGAISIQGFQDLTINRDLTSTAAISITASRDLNISATRTITGGAASAFALQAANGSAVGTGNLNISGNLSAGTGAFTLLSGNNGGRPNWTATTTNLVAQSGTFGNVNIQGFGTLTLNRAITSSGTFVFSNNTLTALGANLTSTGSMTFSNAVSVVEAASVNLSTTNAAVLFSSTLNGTASGVAENITINSGTAATTFTGLVGSTTALGNMTVTADNVTISANMRGTGTLTLQPSTAARVVVLGGAQADTLTTNGLNLSSAEAGRILSSWTSVVLGSTAAGNLTNSYANWVNPVTFMTGNDFINSTPINASAASTILVRATRDVVLNQSITTANTSANAITLVAGRNLNNVIGASALTTGAGGRWLVYSSNPTGSVGEQLLSNAFNRYSCAYGGSCPALAAGNGLLYSFTPTLDVTVSGQTYTYGDAVIVPTGYVLSTSNYINALDTSQGTVGGTGIFQTTYVQGNNAGSSYTITDNGSTFASNLGYGFNFITPTGTVQQRNITVQANNQSQTYGFGGLGTTGFSISAGALYNTDAIGGVTLSTNALVSAGGQYNYSATPWTLSASAATFSSGLIGNYNITYASASTGLTVARRALTIGATGTNKTFDGTTAATIALHDNRVAGDALTLSYSAAGFVDANVGTGKTVNVTGIGVAGVDAANYVANTVASTIADILATSSGGAGGSGGDVQSILRSPAIPDTGVDSAAPNIQLANSAVFVRASLLPNTVRKVSYTQPRAITRGTPNIFLYYDRLIDLRFQLSALETPWEY